MSKEIPEGIIIKDRTPEFEKRMVESKKRMLKEDKKYNKILFVLLSLSVLVSIAVLCFLVLGTIWIFRHL